ncbi:MAG: cadmium-translocating P-type ATPase [Anaerolineae bacterium]|nr:cadmium-translocating P-type ATPase [Anaerolineae bacterium]
MNAVKTSAPLTTDTTHTPGPRPVWLTAAWLEPRLVPVTLLAILASLAGEHAGLPRELTLLFDLIAYVAGGLFGVKSALASLAQRKLDVDLLMVLAAVGAASIGEWHEGAILLFLFSLSNVLQDYAIGRSRSAIQSLFKLYPEQAQVRRGDQVLTVKISEIRLHEVVLIEPGARIPVDGTVLAGRSAVDQAPITGESMPVDKQPGDIVFAGTLNKQGILDIEATRLATETTLARIIKMVEEAQERKAPTERFLEAFEERYALFILGVVALFMVVPPALGLADFATSFYRAMVLMTVASPCALVISVPAAFISAIASAARGGVLFKGGAYLEQLAGVKAIAFDKTGTLTGGEPRLTDLHPAGMTPAALLAAAAAVENRSEHPIARAIVQAARARQVPVADVTDFESEPGRGVQARVNNQTVLIGSIAYLERATPLPADLSAPRAALEAAGKTVIGVLVEGAWAGIIAVADTLRPETPQVVAGLRAMGLEVAMLTGDNVQVARSIAAQAGITRVYAGLMPEDKVTALQALQREFGSVAMVGDGVNDAPALALADIGIAMGAAGTDVALETADVVLMADKLERIPAAIRLSQQARRVVWQNITFSLLVIVLLVAGTFLVALPLPLGVLGHEGSTVIVVLNGLITLLILPELQRRRAGRALPA